MCRRLEVIVPHIRLIVSHFDFSAAMSVGAAEPGGGGGGTQRGAQVYSPDAQQVRNEVTSSSSSSL